jgi:hypothetical protein
VFQVSLGELGNSGLDSGHSLAGSSHLLGRVVGVTSSTVPVSSEGLGVERGLQVSIASSWTSKRDIP